MDNHGLLIPKLWQIVDDNGAFAAQIPKFEKMPINNAINKIINKDKWFKDVTVSNGIKTHHELDYYYELLHKETNNIVLWETHYFHIVPSLQSIIDFVHTTALKPYLELLPNEEKRKKFENEILEECKEFYKTQSDGKVLFPFERMFFIAYKN
jgi:trans-aconitate 2-methyltransferase